MIVIGTGGRRLTLLVVSPPTHETVAWRALAEAAQTAADPAAAPIAVKVGEAADESRHDLTRRLKRPSRTDGRVENTAIIEQLVHQAEQQFQDAPIQASVPILVEHIVRQQIGSNVSTT